MTSRNERRVDIQTMGVRRREDHKAHGTVALDAEESEVAFLSLLAI